MLATASSRRKGLIAAKCSARWNACPERLTAEEAVRALPEGAQARIFIPANLIARNQCLGQGLREAKHKVYKPELSCFVPKR
jgi:hypothetical protein